MMLLLGPLQRPIQAARNLDVTKARVGKQWWLTGLLHKRPQGLFLQIAGSISRVS